MTVCPAMVLLDSTDSSEDSGDEGVADGEAEEEEEVRRQLHVHKTSSWKFIV